MPPSRIAPNGRLVYLGNAVVDLVLAVPRLPDPGEDVRARAASWVPGGGVSTMVAAARRGMGVCYAGRTGTGPLAELIRSRLRREGIVLWGEPVAGQDNGVVICLVEPDGQRAFVTTTGAEALLEAEHLQGLAVGPTDLVALTGYGLAHPVNGLALAGWLATIPDETVVLLDPGPWVGDAGAGVLDRVLPRVDWYSCNAREARLATGCADLAVAAERLSAGTGRVGILVRDGERGCWLRLPGTPAELVAGDWVPPDGVKDTTGAGDVHAGVFLAELAAGRGAKQAVAAANAVAAESIRHPGPGLPFSGLE
ncbi:PfkB family carbohydrate kinase [Jatrophihabitans telluris]|uniref:PfkB family carbohydrate kinase n=1 Tax=Jatrophihabitans telluris TaxID=2038343 RepID=A0ABY4R226_9ACTN|nr:PfkB family carbohydrate kinase [Jatrophihabitans telluris]UQX89785.1 PfkB family carbohydrate kinase [Jatrophihabitans telluris]